jgi:hypothetical protein
MSKTRISVTSIYADLSGGNMSAGSHVGWDQFFHFPNLPSVAEHSSLTMLCRVGAETPDAQLLNLFATNPIEAITTRKANCCCRFLRSDCDRLTDKLIAGESATTDDLNSITYGNGHLLRSVTLR